MARRRRSSSFRNRGDTSPLSSASLLGAAPDFSFQHDELEDAGRRAQRPYELVGRAPVESVYQPRVVSVEAPRTRRMPYAGMFRGGFNVWSALRSLLVRKQVDFCVRRKQRRESLFALRRIGFRGSSPGTRSRYTGKYYRRTGNSQYRCV